MIKVSGKEILAIHTRFCLFVIAEIKQNAQGDDWENAFSTIFLVTNLWKKRMFFVAKMSHAENFQKL